MKNLVFATNNAHKIEEVQMLLGSTANVLSLDKIGFKEEVEETGNTFRENAFLKAKAVFDFCKKPIFSDDSGLVVEALDGEPGVDSAHYSGSRDAEKNNLLLLEKLKNKSNRNAYFVCMICLIDKDGKEHFFEGRVDGRITNLFSGEKGFGYDPIFVPSGFEQTFAQMSMAEKNAQSHRVRALAKMVEYIKTIS